MKLAAIDIGSNAVRLLLCNAYTKDSVDVFKKAELIRIPLRLGEDAFTTGKISSKKADKLVKAMQAFKNLIDVYEVVDYKACATSAMRDAQNGNELIERIKKEADLKIEIIDGKTEANIIYSNHIEEKLDKNTSYLYIDIGGGSTEITLFSKNKIIASQSFNIGTIRFLHNQVEKEYWNNFKNWVKEITDGYSPLMAIGSGGNLNKLFKMTRKKDSKPVSYNKIKYLYELFQSMSMEERIANLGLNPDRADVIVPATKIVLAVMKSAGIEKIIIPQIGLADGIVHKLYEKHKEKIAEKAA